MSDQFHSQSLDISKLNEILGALTYFKFSKPRWFELGGELELLHNELTVIETNHRGDVGRCLRECLSLWLKTPRIWQVLIAALRSIGEVTVAEGILELENPASQFLQQYSSRFSQTVLHKKIVRLLHTEGVVTEETASEIEKCGCIIRGSQLISLRLAVAENQKKLKIFIGILQMRKETISLASEIAQKYGELPNLSSSSSSSSMITEDSIPEQDIVDISSKMSHETSSGNNTETAQVDQVTNTVTQNHTTGTSTQIIEIGPDKKSKFDQMRYDLAHLVCQVSSLLRQNVSSLNDLKLFLMIGLPEIKPLLKQAESFDNVMEIIGEKCSLINTSLLKELAKKYSFVDDANAYLSEYEEKLDAFCDLENSLRICNNVQLRNSSTIRLKCETIKFILNWNIDDHTLNDIRDLLNKAFGSLANRVEVEKAGEVNSIFVTCYAPHYLMESLLVIASGNLHLLKEEGLISLTIGYCTVYNQSAIDQEVIKRQEGIVSLKQKDSSDIKSPLVHDHQKAEEETLQLNIDSLDEDMNHETFVENTPTPIESTSIQFEDKTYINKSVSIIEEQSTGNSIEYSANPSTDKSSFDTTAEKTFHLENDPLNEEMNDEAFVKDILESTSIPFENRTYNNETMSIVESDEKQSTENKDDLKMQLHKAQKKIIKQQEMIEDMIVLLTGEGTDNKSADDSSMDTSFDTYTGTDTNRKLKEELADRNRHIAKLMKKLHTHDANLYEETFNTDLEKDCKSFESDSRFSQHLPELNPPDIIQAQFASQKNLPKPYYGIGDVTKPVGVSLKCSLFSESITHTSFKDYILNYTHIGDLIKDQNVVVKVRPILISFSGLPECGKKTALKNFLHSHVEKCPYEPITDKGTGMMALDINQYELIADGSTPLVNFTLSEAMKESYFAFGVLSAFKNIYLTNERVPVLDNGERLCYFKDPELEICLLDMYQYLFNQHSISKISSGASVKMTAASGLVHSFPDCLALINIWDYSISNVVRHLLSALQGHLYNHHMFLFLDLERDLKHLDKPPKMKHEARDGAVFMKWRPRLHYLLRSAWATEEKGKEKRRACTVFAKIQDHYDESTKEKIDKLERYVKQTAKLIGVYKMLDLKVQHINVETDAKCIQRKIGSIVNDIPPKEIPLAWIFLRTWLYDSKNIIVSKSDLKIKAKDCGISNDSFTEFCKFYTSFGSIIDLSLANRDYQYVIIHPVTFLTNLDNLLNPHPDKLLLHPSLKFGIIPQEFSKSVITENWDAFMDALESLNLVTSVTIAVLDPPDFPLPGNLQHHYASLSYRGTLIQEVDPISIHLITNINTSHIFKQVSFVKQFLKCIPYSKLVPCDHINQSIIKVMGTTVSLAFHSPAIRIHLDYPNSYVCQYVIKVFNEIAKHALENGVTIKYKFVQMCAKAEVPPKVQSILSSHYHTLPHENIQCSVCSKDEKKREILRAWNQALTKVPILLECEASGDIDKSELSYVVKKVLSICVDKKGIQSFTKNFWPGFTVKDSDMLPPEEVFEETLFSWYDDVCGKKNGGPKPRRALAEAIFKAGEETTRDHADAEKLLTKFEYVAKNIDIFWKSPRQKANSSSEHLAAAFMKKLDKDIFKSKVDVLSNALATRAHFTPFVDKLVANSLITSAFRDDITSTPHYSDYERAIRLVNHVYNNIRVPSSPDYFSRICEALQSQDDPTLKDIGKTMMI